MSHHPFRILHVIPQLGIGGAENQLYMLISKSDREKFKHEILYYSDSNDEEGFKICDNLGIKYNRISQPKKRSVNFLMHLVKEIKIRHPDIVHCWLYSGVIWGRWAAILAGTKNIIVSYRSTYLSHPKILRLLEKFTTNKVHYLANSKACARAVAKVLGVSFSRFNVIYNGLDLSRFENVESGNVLRHELGISEGRKIVTMVGRLTYAKNYPMYLRVAQKCKQTKLPVHFVAVGHGERESELLDLRSKLGIEDLVTFVGLRHDIPQILKSSDIFLFTSLYEGFPNSLLEAMAVPLPIVCTDFQCAKELIDNNINGILVKQNDVDAAYEAIKSYIDAPDKAQTFASRAFETVVNNFSGEQMLKKNASLYLSLIEGKNN